VFKNIDEALAGVLGINVRDAIYLALLTNFSVTREELPKHLDKFEQLLEDNIGQRAAKVIFRAIAKRLYSELNLTFSEEPTYSLTDYVMEAKLRTLKPSSDGSEAPHNSIRTQRKPSWNGDSH